MSEALNELFSALEQSEQAAVEEKNKYLDAKKNIQAANEKLRRETDKRLEITEEIQALEKSLDGVEIATEEVKLKETFLVERIGLFHSENTDKKSKMVSLREAFKTRSMQLMSQVKEFSDNYGLLNSSSRRREGRMENARSSAKKIALEIENAEREIEHKRACMAGVNELLKTREELLAMNESLTSKENGIHTNMFDDEAQIRQLQSEKLALETAPECGEDFLQVNSDLEKYQTSELEARAEELHTQLSAVTDAVRRQEGLSLKQQYRRWQRQRHMQQHQQQQHHHHQQQQQHPYQNQQQQQQRESAQVRHDHGGFAENDEDRAAAETEDVEHNKPRQGGGPQENDEPLSFPTDRPGFAQIIGKPYRQNNHTDGNECNEVVSQRTLTNGREAKVPSLSRQAGSRGNESGENTDLVTYGIGLGKTTDTVPYGTREATDLAPYETRETTDRVLYETRETTDRVLYETRETTDLVPDEVGETTDLAKKAAGVTADLAPPLPEERSSQEDILCPSASTTASEAGSKGAGSSHHGPFDNSSQSTIFISSPS